MTFCCFFSDYCIICIIYLRWMCRQKATLFCTISIKISFFENLFIGFHVDGLKSGRKYAVQLLFESEILSFLFYFTFLCFLIFNIYFLCLRCRNLHEQMATIVSVSSLFRSNPFPFFVNAAVLRLCETFRDE